jgi:hypothetical protein
MKLLDIYEASVDGSLEDEENVAQLTKLVTETGLRQSQYERMTSEAEKDRSASNLKAAAEIANIHATAAQALQNNASDLTHLQIQTLSDRLKSSRSDTARLAQLDATVVSSEMQRVMDSLGGVDAGDRNGAAWQAFLGSATEPGVGRLFSGVHHACG